MKNLAGSRQQAADSGQQLAVSGQPSAVGRTSNFGPRTSDFGPRTSHFGPHPPNSKLQTPIPKLTIVGAGPGDPELITVKGLKALQRADVVLYDALVDEALLQFAPAAAARIFVGKRKGKPSFKQEEINEMMVDFAKLFGHVVRLKGGDPYVFGRGLEEIQYAASHGLAVQYIPGISSVVAGPGSVGIPVTLRGASRGFWVLTATTDTGELNPEVVTAAHTGSTVVILMGLTKMPEIAQIYADAGKSNWPVAIISNATLPNEKSITGTMADILEKLATGQIVSPAIIVAGEVVNHQFKPIPIRKKIFQP